MSESAPASAVSPAKQEAAVGAVLDDLKTFRARLWAPILLGVIMLFDSWDSIAIAYVMPSLRVEWGLSPLLIGFLISAGYLGQFIGAVGLGALGEKFGRMPVFIVAVIIMCVLALGTAFAPNYEVMFVLRLVQGLTIGGALPIAATYINEIAPTKTRGRYFALYQVLAMSGYSAAAVASTFVIPNLGWRWLMGLGAIPILFLPLVWMTLPESPRWLARMGRLDEANRALAKLGGGPAKPVEVSASEPPAEKAGPRLNVGALFGSEFRGRTAIITTLWFLCAFANFGLTTWIPSIYVSEFGIPLERALQYAALGNITFLIIAPLAGLVMDRTGRRPIAIAGTLIAAVTMFAIAIHRPAEEWLLVTVIILGYGGISAAVLIMWPFTAETYPTNVRALGVGYGSSIARGASMLTPLVAGVILSIGAPISIVFATYGACALGALIVWVTLTRETARKALDSI